MQGKVLVIMAELSLALTIWWATRSEDEQRAIQARCWRELEQASMRVAKAASDFAAFAEHAYKETVAN